MASEKQIAANRQNSSKSSGPKSTAGKETVSRNATRHGILSNRLFLSDEDPAEFQQLFDDLQSNYKPQGILEMVLVEKIAVAFWKQRRVTAAETAAITLSRQDTQIFKSINTSLGKYRSGEYVTKENLDEMSPKLKKWAQTVVDEWNALAADEDKVITPEEMEQKAPASWQSLQEDAQSHELSVEDYLDEQGMDIYDWFNEYSEKADTLVRRALLRQQVLELHAAALAELSILPDKPRASFERYQATLDNQLYRAMKELRQLQEQRLKQLEVMAQPGSGGAQADEAELT